jgi:hypothetical protein
MRMASKTATTTAPNAAECQSFLDNLVADLPRVRLSNDSTNGNSAGRIAPPQPASPVSRILLGYPLKKPGRAALYARPPVSNAPAIKSKSAIFAENLWSVFEKFSFGETKS